MMRGAKYSILALLLAVLSGSGCALHKTQMGVLSRNPETGATEDVRFDEMGLVTVGSKQKLAEGEFAYRWDPNGGGALGAGGRGVGQAAGDGAAIIEGVLALGRIAAPLLQALGESRAAPEAAPSPSSSPLDLLSLLGGSGGGGSSAGLPAMDQIRILLNSLPDAEGTLWALLQGMENEKAITP